MKRSFLTWTILVLIAGTAGWIRFGTRALSPETREHGAGSPPANHGLAPAAQLAATTPAPSLPGPAAPVAASPTPATTTAAADTSGESQISPEAARQIGQLQREKSERTPVQRKIDSKLLRLSHPDALLPAMAANQQGRPGPRTDEAGRVLVDVKADIQPALLASVATLGGTVVNSFPEEQAMRAWLPLDQVETLSARPGVDFVQPAVPARTHSGKVVSEGDVVHKTAQARTKFAVDGSGVKIGVLSDSVTYLARSQASNELGKVTTLTGQAGTGAGEGTAMLEIIHDLAPGADLYFASAMNSPAAFAQNIRQLRAAGCDIIVDDVGYYDESPFQDGAIAKAVNDVTAKGALYFSAAGNSGSKVHGTSSTWEGDFHQGSANWRSFGPVHLFGTNEFNAFSEGRGDEYAALFWADPLGKSTNDYDLYVLDASGQNVVASSDNYQSGKQDPYELVDSIESGQRIVVVLSSGAPRFLHLDTGGGALAVSTDGSTRGHNCAADAFCVAAVDIHVAYPNAFTARSETESFSCDGPRKMFFNADGTAITPGDFSQTGGVVRSKPDLAAADGVSTSVPGFGSFFGTSAAAPHAAAIAALAKSYKLSLSAQEMRTLLTGTALDDEAAGFDDDSGAGIAMPYAALSRLAADAVAAAASPKSIKMAFGWDAAAKALRVHGNADKPGIFTLEASSDLRQWTPLQTITSLTPDFDFAAINGTNEFQYYRLTNPVGNGK